MARSISNQELILDRPLDEDDRPLGDGRIVNPMDPITEQRYLLKEIDTGSGTPLPTIGVVVGF